MEVMQGADFSISVIFTNRSNSAIDLDGCVARAMVKANISDSDADALVSIVSTGATSGAFDLTDASSGRFTVVVPGSYTASVDVNKKLRTYAQVEAALDGHYYRSENITLDLIESVFDS